VNPVVSYILVPFTLQSKSSDFNYLIVYNLSIFNFNQILILILGFTWAKVNTSEEFHWPPVQRRGSPRSFRGTHLPEWCKFSYVWEFCFIYTNTDELFNLLDRQVVQLVLHFRIPGQQEANVTKCSGCLCASLWLAKGLFSNSAHERSPFQVQGGNTGQRSSHVQCVSRTISANWTRRPRIRHWKCPVLVQEVSGFPRRLLPLVAASRGKWRNYPVSPLKLPWSRTRRTSARV